MLTILTLRVRNLNITLTVHTNILETQLTLKWGELLMVRQEIVGKGEGGD